MYSALMLLLFAPALAVLSACAPVSSVVPDAAGQEPLDMLSMTCQQPYLLTQDCADATGARRHVSLDGLEVKVAGSAQGNLILLMDANLPASVNELVAGMVEDRAIGTGAGPADDALPWNSPRHTRDSNRSYRAVRNVLDRAGIAVIRVRPIVRQKIVDGYLIETHGDGYTLLKSFTVGK